MKKFKEVTLGNQIDINNCDRCRQLLTAALAERPDILVLDMQSVVAIDSCGLGVLIAALRQIRTWGGEIAICAPSEMVRMLLKLTNTHKIFAIYNSYAEFMQAQQVDVKHSDRHYNQDTYLQSPAMSY
jgi:anti-anti-sigma factor